MAFETITYGTHDGVATIELGRPEKLNAMSALMFNELGEAAEQAASDPGVRVVLLRGQGRAFCAGLDVNLLGQLAGTRGARFRSFARSAQRPYLLFSQMEKPTVAAVHGHALGSGFQLALACDLRVVADDVRFAMLEVKYGIIPDLGGVEHLTRLVGPAKAKEIVWTGRYLDAAEAERIGIANRVVPAASLTEETAAYVQDLVASPPIPVSMTKSLANRAHETPLETALEREAEAQARCVETEDHKEAVAAYLEQRPPRFTGR